MNKTLTATLILLGLAALPAAALDLAPVAPALRIGAPPSAPQFTFRVPVRLNALLPDTRAFIHCRPLQGSVVKAELSQEVPLDAGGNYNGTVVVAGNLAAGADPSVVDRYGCMLRLQGPGATSPQPPCFGETCPDWWKTRPGTPFRPGVEGVLPR